MSTNESEKKTKVLVIGSGIAGITLITDLAKNSKNEILMFDRSSEIGGICLNSGCVPLELFWKNPKINSKDVSQYISRSIQEKVQKLKISYFNDELIKVEGNTAFFLNGRFEIFDALYLATGIRYIEGLGFSYHRSFDIIMNAPRGSSIIIQDDGDMLAWSLADMAIEGDLDVTVAKTAKGNHDDLPGSIHFISKIRERGVRFVDCNKIIDFKDKVLEVKTKTEFLKLSCDYFISPQSYYPNIPPIDGKQYSLKDINRFDWTIGQRDNIFVAGDVAGFKFASQAEAQARALVNPQKDFNSEVPIRYHASTPLALIGQYTNLQSLEWYEIDFERLGWSTIHSEGGKLWYALDATKKSVAAFQIYHKYAQEIAPCAQLFLGKNFDDSAWRSSFVHPSAAEIFKEVAIDAESRIDRKPDNSIRSKFIKLNIPDLVEIEDNVFFKRNFTSDQIKNSLISKDPAYQLSLTLVQNIMGISKEETQSLEKIYSKELGLLIIKIEGSIFEITIGAGSGVKH